MAGEPRPNPRASEDWLMGLIDRVVSLASIPRYDRVAEDQSRVKRAVLQERSILFESTELPVSDQIAAIRRRRANADRPWRAPTVRDALGVPAIFRSVALISNTAGALSLRAFRDGVLLSDSDRPQIVKRPQPRRTPGQFTTDTVFSIATRGEGWWWIAKRDGDGLASALVVVPAREIRVEENPNNRLRPTILWGDRIMPNEDMVQICYLQEPGELRGFGPLQMCGAAISVSVEAQEWAANFYADGAHAPLVIRSAVELGANPDDPDDLTEAERLAEGWAAKGNNRPRVIDPRIEDVKQLEYNESGAQMLDSRNFQVGEAVRMLGVPPALLAYATAGSSLTYQNVGQLMELFATSVLWPDYLEKVEQALSDLLTRSTVARFNIDALTRADIKTRWDVYKTAVDVVGPDEAAAWARRSEGFEPGDIENAPVPFSPPQSIPTIVPQQRSIMRDVNCPHCGRLAVRADGPVEAKCHRCGKLFTAA